MTIRSIAPIVRAAVLLSSLAFFVAPAEAKSATTSQKLVSEAQTKATPLLTAVGKIGHK